MARRNSTRTPRAKEALKPLLLDLSVVEAVDVAQTWCHTNHLLDDLDTHNLDQDLDMFLGTCRDLHLTTYEAVLNNLSVVITQTSGLPATTFLNAQDSHQHFRVRNHIGAALAAAAQQFDNNPHFVIAHLPTPHPRAGGAQRPCTDDEILLLRLKTLHAIKQGGRSLLAGLQYVLVESGALPVEAALANPAHFDNMRHPTRVILQGATHHQPRAVGLPRWTHAPLITAMDAHLASSAQASTRRICYVGQSDDRATMSASASAMLRRTMIAAGLTEDCVEPKSVLKWRVQHALTTGGFDAALPLLGKTEPIQIHHFLNGHSRSKPKKPPKRRTFLY